MKDSFRIFGFLVCILLLCCVHASAQEGKKEEDSVKNKNLRTSVFPVVFYLPETRWAFGAFGVATFRFRNQGQGSNASKIQVGAAYTLNRQWLFYVPFELYWKQDQWKAEGELGFYKYFYNFYGLGINSAEANKEIYQVDYPRMLLKLSKKIDAFQSVGPAFAFDYYNITDIEANGIIANLREHAPLGKEVFLLGLHYQLDSRDHIYYPTKGSFVQFSSLISATELGAAQPYTKWTFDARHFIKTGPRTILGGQVFLGTHFGNPPFYQLFYLGEPKISRGFNDRRYTDNSIASVQVELRLDLWTRLKAVVFVGSGTVADKFVDVFSSKQRMFGGLGLRPVINKEEKINIRLDGAITSNGFNFYFTIGEAF